MRRAFAVATAVAVEVGFEMARAESRPVSYWEERWSSGTSNWHTASVNKRLVRHGGALKLGPGSRVFVPLCGKTVDMKFLSDTGAEVLGVEGVESAAREFFVEQTGAPADAWRAVMPGAAVLLTARSSPGADASAQAPLRIAVGDLFDMAGPGLGQFDAAWDRGSFVAIHPDSRNEYVSLMAGAIRPGGVVLLETWRYVGDGPAPAGPPQSVPESEVRACWGRAFRVSALGEEPVRGRKDRFGADWSVGMYVLTRRARVETPRA